MGAPFTGSGVLKGGFLRSSLANEYIDISKYLLWVLKFLAINISCFLNMNQLACPKEALDHL